MEAWRLLAINYSCINKQYLLSTGCVLDTLLNAEDIAVNRSPVPPETFKCKTQDTVSGLNELSYSVENQHLGSTYLQKHRMVAIHTTPLLSSVSTGFPHTPNARTVSLHPALLLRQNALLQQGFLDLDLTPVPKSFNTALQVLGGLGLY